MVGVRFPPHHFTRAETDVQSEGRAALAWIDVFSAVVVMETTAQETLVLRVQAIQRNIQLAC